MNAVQTAVQRALADAAGRVYVGFSGGLDSSVLLHAVAARRPGDVVAVHVNHGLNAAADTWQAHCAATATRLGVGWHAERVTVPPGNVEAGARRARYRVFGALLGEPADALWLAHHRDDQTETILLRLLQGRGSYGMPARRALGAGVLLRPLLDLERHVLRNYAEWAGLSWCEDPSNADLRLARNDLRHRLLPRLRARWPGVDDALHAAMQHVATHDGALRAAHHDVLEAAALPVAALRGEPAEEARAMLRLWLTARSAQTPPRRALDEFLRQLHSARADRRPSLDLGSASVRVHAGALHRVAAPPELADGYALAVPGRLDLPHGTLRVTADPEGFRPAGSVTVRFRSGGERLLQGGRHRRVKHLLADAGVPPWQRATHPLLYDALGLAAVAGIAHRDRGRVPGEDRGGAAFRAEWDPA